VTGWWRVAILLGLVLVLLFAGLGRVALTDRDEGANAEAAREMLEQGSWITPTFNYAPRFAKPALVYWLMAAGYAAFGVSEATARLPSAVAAAALVGLQYGFARWLAGPAVAFRAAVILLLCAEFVAVARLALTDAVLTLWTTTAGLAFFRAHYGSPPRGRWYVAMYLALALAVLTKGPVGVLVPIAGIALYLAVAGGWARVWREARPAPGALLLLLVAAPWYGAMLWTHGADYLARARGETLGRVFRTVTGPGGTILFYVPVVLIGFFPWSALLPGALAGALRGARSRAAGGGSQAFLVFAAAWVAAVLVGFSLVQSRLPHYVAPIFPYASLLLAIAWPASVPALARGLLAALGLLLGLTLAAAWMLSPAVERLLVSAYPAEAGTTLPPSLVLLALLALGSASAAGIRDGDRLFPVLATLTAALFAVGLHAVLPAFSARFVAGPGELLRQAAPGLRACDALVALGPYRPSFLFYARRPLEFASLRDRAALGALSPGAGRLFLLTPRVLVPQLPPGLGALPAVDARGGYVLLASPTDARPCPPAAAGSRP
jgi:hypothetical protein